MRVEYLKIWFCKRVYPENLIKEQIEKAFTLTPSDENNSKNVCGVSLVVTYNPALGCKKKPSVITCRQTG